MEVYGATLSARVHVEGFIIKDKLCSQTTLGSNSGPAPCLWMILSMELARTLCLVSVGRRGGGEG